MIEDIATFAKSTIEAGRKAERNYAALVEHYALTHELTSGVITDTAREIVMTAYPRVTVDDLTGRDNGKQSWRDARTVRAGLVRNIAKPETEDDESEDDADSTDWLALVRQAALNAQNHEVAESAVVAAVLDTLGLSLADLTSGQVA